MYERIVGLPAESTRAPAAIPVDRQQCRETVSAASGGLPPNVSSLPHGSTRPSIAGARVIMVDNYDSFTFNLVQYLLELGAHVDVVANDATSVAAVRAARPTHVVLSPGPGAPAQSGACLELCRWALQAGDIPLLGVCLGHQALCAVAGADVAGAGDIVHGKASLVEHDGTGLFHGLPAQFLAGRYHSLMVRASTLPAELRPTAWTTNGELMAVAHETRPLFGVQFHPESVLTEHGHTLLGNFLRVDAASYRVDQHQGRCT